MENSDYGVHRLLMLLIYRSIYLCGQWLASGRRPNDRNDSVSPVSVTKQQPLAQAAKPMRSTLPQWLVGCLALDINVG